VFHPQDLQTLSFSAFHRLLNKVWRSNHCMMSASGAKPIAQLYRSDSQDDAILSEKTGTERDQRDMNRMGKKQEFRRNFGFVSIFGYSMTLMATWETTLT
jgi:choline transport protein